MITAILQARMSSTRLPGKVMKSLMDKEMIVQQIERIKQCKHIEQLVIATSTDSSDDPLAELCRQKGILFYRGSLENVLDRYYQAARSFNASHVVRLTGDCPLADPDIIDQIIRQHLDDSNDFTCNTMPASEADGLDTEVMTISTLERLKKVASLPSETEHVTRYVYTHKDEFKIGNVVGKSDSKGLRWTVDNPEDFELISRIYGYLYPTNPNFRTADVINLLSKHPELKDINLHINRNEGLDKSLLKDQAFLKQQGVSNGNGY